MEGHRQPSAWRFSRHNINVSGSFWQRRMYLLALEYNFHPGGIPGRPLLGRALGPGPLSFFRCCLLERRVSCCASHWGKALGRWGSDQPLPIVTTPTTRPLSDSIGEPDIPPSMSPIRSFTPDCRNSLFGLCTASNAHQATESSRVSAVSRRVQGAQYAQ
jgi:hypothetical protein